MAMPPPPSYDSATSETLLAGGGNSPLFMQQHRCFRHGNRVARFNKKVTLKFLTSAVQKSFLFQPRLRTKSASSEAASSDVDEFETVL